MIERFFSDTISELGTEKVTVYTAPDDMNFAFVTGLYVSNISDRNTTMEVFLYQKKYQKEIHLTSAKTPLPAGSTASVAALGQRLQLTPGDYISVQLGHEKCGDVMVSVSEVIYTQDDLKAMEIAAKANISAGSTSTEETAN